MKIPGLQVVEILANVNILAFVSEMEKTYALEYQRN